MKTIYLYLKESPLGLKYLGKTIQNPYKYKGSGKYWVRHLKFHKISTKSIKTKILYTSNNIEDIREKGLYFSELYNIVNSNEFANLVNESGEGSFGWLHTNETKEKISKAGIGRKISKEGREKISNSRKGKCLSEETKEKIRLKNKNYKHTEEAKLKISKALKGRKMSEEFCKKMSIIHKGKKISETERLRLISINTGRIHSEESKLKRSIKLKGRKPSKEQLQKQKDKICRKIINKETKELFESITQCSIKNNIKVGTLYAQLIRNSKCCKFEFI